MIYSGVSILLLLSYQLHVCTAHYRVYIPSTVLESYFKNTTHFDTVQGHHVDITQSQVLDNGSLILIPDSEGSGSGMLEPGMDLTDILLPTLPPSVDQVTITWLASTMVDYVLSVRQEPDGVFSSPSQDIPSVPASGNIPTSESNFTLDVSCSSEPMGEGALILSLTTIERTTNSTRQTNFTIKKDCGEPSSTSLLLSTMTSSMAISQSTLSLSFSTSIMTQTSSPLEATPTPTSIELVPSSQVLSTTISPTSTNEIPKLLPSSVSTTSIVMSVSSEEMLLPESMSLMPDDTLTSVFSLRPTMTTFSSQVPSISLFVSSARQSSNLPSTSLISSSVVPTPVAQTTTSPSQSLTLNTIQPSLVTSQTSITDTVTVSSPISTVSSQTSTSITVSITRLSSEVPVTSISQSTPSISTEVPVTSSTPSISTEVPVTSLPQSTSTEVPVTSLPQSTSTEVPVTSLPQSTSTEVPVTSLPQSTSTEVPVTSLPQSTSTEVPVTSLPQSTSTEVPVTSLPQSTSTEVPVISLPQSTSTEVPVTSLPQSTSTEVPVISLPQSTSTEVPVTLIPQSTPSISSEVSVLLTTTVLPTNSPGVFVNGTVFPTTEPDLRQVYLIAFAPVVGILFICIAILLCFIACVVCKRKKSSKQFSDDPAELPVPIFQSESHFLPGAEEMEESFKKSEAPISLWMALPWGVVSTLPKSIQGVIKSFSVDRRSLSILSTINRGEFGCIVNGQLSVDRTDLIDGHKGVMMKMLIGFEGEYGHHNEIAKFLEHATLLRGLEHPNLATVMRISVEDNLVPLVLYPIVEYGNLHTFLTFCRVSPQESPLNPVTLQYKVNFGLQIAYAMKFLSVNGVVHPDLALRNCLLDTNYLVKVGDGALSQEFYPNCYHTIRGSVRPVRWAALETLQEGLCTSQSNVWTFGVTLWEMVTMAELPYGEVNNNRSIPSHVMMGARLEQPTNCPGYLYEVMQACWEAKAESRPNFTFIYNQLEEINNQLGAAPSPNNSYGTPNLARDDGQNSVCDNQSREPSHSLAGLDYSPVPSSYQSRRRRSGRSSFSKNSPSIRRKSTQSRVSGAGSEHLSLTFSVLSGDIGSETSSENDEGPEVLSPLAESVVFQMLPSLLKDDHEENAGVKQLPSSSPLNLVSSFLDVGDNNNSIELEHSSKYTPLPSTFFSPGPTTPSTITTRLTPCETTSYTSSQFGPSTIRSDDSMSTPLPTASPSPELTSKSSTFGEETRSTSSNPRFSYISHSNADSVSKTSGNDSIGNSDYPPSAGNGSNSYAHTNGLGHENARINLTEPPIANGSDSIPLESSTPIRTNEVSDSNGGHKDIELNGYNGLSNGDKPAVKSQTETSFELGLGDLSSDLMATFDSWK